MAFRFYADRTPRKLGQVLADVLFLGVAYLGYLLGSHLADSVRTARDGATSLHDGAKTLADNLSEAGSALGKLPFVGSEASKPVDKAAGSAGDLAASGQNLADGLERTATILGPLITIGTILLLTMLWLLTRGRYVRRASRVEELSTFAEGRELLALEAKLGLAPKRWRDLPPSELPNLMRTSLGLRPLESDVSAGGSGGVHAADTDATEGSVGAQRTGEQAAPGRQGDAQAGSERLHEDVEGSGETPEAARD